MRLGQIKAEGGYLAAIFEGDLARAVPGYTVTDLIRRSEAQGVSIGQTTARLASHPPEPPPPALPLVPPGSAAADLIGRSEARGVRIGQTPAGFAFNDPAPPPPAPPTVPAAVWV